jgi:hypothetical protein
MLGTAQVDNSALLDALVGLLAERVTEKAQSANAHGPGGLLGLSGLPPYIVNAMVMPVGGLEARLPRMASQFEYPPHTILTGMTASEGDEPTANCTDCRTPGQLKICNQVWVFGRQCMDTRVLDLSETGQLINRGEFRDQRIIGNPFGAATASSNMPRPFNLRDALQSDATKKLAELVIAFQRDYAGLHWTGNPANTAANTGGYKEYNGLERLVNTGYRDAFSRRDWTRCGSPSSGAIRCGPS